MEEFVVSDLCESKDIQSVALLDGDGFVKAIEPNQEKNKHLMSQLGNNLNNSNEFQSTTLITDKHIILVQQLRLRFSLCHQIFVLTTIRQSKILDGDNLDD